MPVDVVRFVDSLSPGAAVRLDLNDDVKWLLAYDRTDLSPPELKASWANSSLRDGEALTSAAFPNRILRLGLDLITSSVDEAGAEIQKLWRELARPTNFLRWQVNGATNPVWLRTLRSSRSRVIEVPGAGTLRHLDVEIVAEPHALGEEVTLGPYYVNHDPGDGAAVNANPYIETDASSWTVTGGSIARSTAQAHEGAASLLLTPDGVSSSAAARTELLPATVGSSWQASAWVRCAVSRNVNINIDWRTGGGALVSTATATVAVSAGIWTQLNVSGTAPATTAQVGLTASMTGTPPAGNTLHIDEAKLRPSGPGDVGGQCFDLGGIKGDLQTPLVLRTEGLGTTQSGIAGVALWAVRRRGTVTGTAVPFILQAEAMTPLGTDTSTVAGGSGGSSIRCTFATNATHIQRTGIIRWPASPSASARGRYRVFGRLNKSNAADVIVVSLRWDNRDNARVTLPQSALTRLVDLGDVQIPSGYDPVSVGFDGIERAATGIDVSVWMSRTSGSGNVDLDYLIFVPADDRLSIVSYNALPVDGYAVYDGPNRMVYGLSSTGAIDPAGAIAPSSIDEGADQILVSPGVTNRIYLIKHPTTTGPDHIITGTAPVRVSYWPRYLYLRPVSS